MSCPNKVSWSNICVHIVGWPSICVRPQGDLFEEICPSRELESNNSVHVATWSNLIVFKSLHNLVSNWLCDMFIYSFNNKNVEPRFPNKYKMVEFDWAHSKNI